ncbi:uncharacterized protein LOC107458652 [Arachis duranensis]|uniref:Uncharacterized protein LOC107458652 n=1 Tax=Arachis duranensis TaxID=130453 RepID=A0A6P4AX25_ARADU|nr:uncharacterized protein LOC107458652 [Arachis duranensis]
MDWFSWLSRTTLHPSLIYDYGLTFARNELQLEDATHFNHELLQSMGISIAKHRLEILKLVNKQQQDLPPPPPPLRPNKKLSAVLKRCLRKCMNKLVIHGQDVNLKNMPQPPPQIEPNWQHQGKWKGMVMRKQGSEEKEEMEKPALPVPPIYRSKTIALSGPLDGRMHEKVAPANKAIKLSGPLDGRMHDRMMVYTNRSPLRSSSAIRPVLDSRLTRGPRLSGPLDARLMAENRSPRMPILRNSDASRLVEPDESPLGFSPGDKLDFDFDVDDDVDDHTLWPTLFQDLKPT